MRAWSIGCQGIVAMAGVCWTIDYYMEKKSVFKYLVKDILFTNKVIKKIHSIHYEMNTVR